MGTDHGSGPANPVSPAKPATENQDQPNIPATPQTGSTYGERPGPIRGEPSYPVLEPLEDDEDAAREIEAEFKRRIAGLRRLSRHARVAALRFAREQRSIALRALKEKRQRTRQARYEAWRQRQPGQRHAP